MGIRDSLRDWVEPFDTATGLKPGDKVIAKTSSKYEFGTVPVGAELVVESVPMARHGADPYELSSVNWTDPETGVTHEGLEWALSPETERHHFGEPPPKTELHTCQPLAGPRPKYDIRVTQDPNDPTAVLVVAEVEVRLWFCPFCGEKLSLFRPW